MKKFILITTIIISLFVCGCSVKEHIKLSYMPSNNTIESALFYPVAVTVTDDRQDILTGLKKQNFIGTFRNTFGYPFEALTDNQLNFSDNLKNDMENDLRSVGIIISSDAPGRTIAISIQEYNFSCYRDCKYWNKIFVEIKDASGKTLHSKTVRDDIVINHTNPLIGPQSTVQKELPKIYAQMIRKMVTEDNAAMNALLRTP